MGRFAILVAALLSIYSPIAQAETALYEVIYGAVLFTLHGDRTPYVLPSRTLTPYGAQQLYTAGAWFRDRYVDPLVSGFGHSTGVSGISAYELQNEQVSVFTYADEVDVTSAQAFMQGLYPPVQSSLNYTFISGVSELANGSNVQFPLNGYQYPNLYTASDRDLNSLYIAGQHNCPFYVSSASEYYATDAFLQLEEDSQSFYDGLKAEILDGVFQENSVGYFDSYFIWDYLNYGYLHNESIAAALSSEQLLEARVLADQWVFALNGNTTASGSVEGDHIRAIAGRTLATEIIQLMYGNVNTQGVYNKLALMFGSFEPMVAFTALAGLATAQDAQFYGQPQYGSSMVFELYSLQANASSSYPEVDDLMVKFLFQNGSGSDLIAYPLFGNDPSVIGISFNEFISGLEDFGISSVENWCTTCGSYSVWCPAYESESDGSDTDTSDCDTGSETSSHGIKPAIAGLIGAIIALVLVALVAVLAMLLGGFRIHRQRTKRRSELGGFKGGEKLASDQDLTLKKSGVGASVVSSGSEPPKGHERIGSWEMSTGQAKETQIHGSATGRRPSLDEDDLHVSPYANPVKPDDKV